MSKQVSLHQQELVSDEIHEVISYRPHWVIRKGNMIFVLIIFFLLSLTWFIKYPDIVSASARLVAMNPPKLVISKSEGRLSKLFVTNGQAVDKDQHLGYIESTASYEQVMKLDAWLRKTIKGVEENNYEILLSAQQPGFAGLGEMQVDYQAFENVLTETKQILHDGYYQKKRNALQKDIQYLARLKNNTAQQKQLLEEDQQLQQKEYNAYKKLEKEKVVAPLELNLYKTKLIAKDQSLKQIDAQMTGTDMSKHNKEKELLELQKQVTDQRQKFRSAVFDLKSQVEKWIHQYVLVASEDGKLIFVFTMRENQMITAGQQLFFIQPHQTGIYVEVMAAQNRLGKIKIGQKVMIKAESYPSNEFGYLEGTVSYISDIPGGRDSFLIKVELPKGLVTNYNKIIFFRNNLLAEAEIITDDRKLFDRLVGDLKQVWQR